MKTFHPRVYGSLLRMTAEEWFHSESPRLGAALAFYTMFAVAPLFVIALAMAGFWFGEEAARRELFAQIGTLVGREGGEAIQAVVAAANQPQAAAGATAAAAVTLLAGATGVFVELQEALNNIWEVRRKPGGGLFLWLRKRLLSLAMVGAIGFLLLVSLVVSAALSALGGLLNRMVPAEEGIWTVLNFVLSLAIITLLFAMIFKVLPDVQIAWRDVWVGALITALLFNLGKLAIGIYLGRSSVASAYGAAGSLVIVLLWVYYSAQILFFGAQFTRLYADQCGSRVRPVAGARFVTVKEMKSASARAH